MAWKKQKEIEIPQMKPTKKSIKQVIGEFLIKKKPNVFEDNGFGQPITDGNLFITGEYLQSLNKNSRKDWVFLIDSLKYKRQLFRFTGDKDLERCQDAVITTMLLYGAVAVRKTSEKQIKIYGITEPKYDFGMNIVKAKGYSPSIIGFGIPVYNRTSNWINLNSSDYTFMRNGLEGMTVLFTEMWAIRGRCKILEIFGKNCMYLPKKSKLRVRGHNSDELEMQLAIATDPDVNLIVEFDQGYDLAEVNVDDVRKDKSLVQSAMYQNSNTFEEFNDRESPNEDTKNDYEFATQVHYDLAGIRYNKSQKAHRSVSAEPMIDQAKVTMLENDLYQNLEYFAEEWNKKYGTNVVVEKILGEMMEQIEKEGEESQKRKAGKD